MDLCLHIDCQQQGSHMAFLVPKYDLSKTLPSLLFTYQLSPHPSAVGNIPLSLFSLFSTSCQE